MTSSLLTPTGTDDVALRVVRAAGAVVEDVSGRSWVDWESGVWCAGLGHNHPAVARAVSRRFTSVSHVGYRWSDPVVEEAAVRLAGIAGMDGGRVVFLSSGSEAVDLGIRIARTVTGRQQLARLGGNYLAAYGAAVEPGWIDLDAEGGETPDLSAVAAFVLEPGNASGTVRLPTAETVETAARRVQDAGGLVVVDEVTTGFGRTGRWFGFQHYDVRPDIVTVGKGAGNGYPVSAVVVTEDVARHLPPGFRYAQSHQDDPASAAVVLAVIQTMEDTGLIDRCAVLGRRLRAALREVADRTGHVTDVRGRGLMCALSLLPPLEGGVAAADAQRGLLDLGHLVGANATRNCLRLYPPFVIDDRHINELKAALVDILTKTHSR